MKETERIRLKQKLLGNIIIIKVLSLNKYEVYKWIRLSKVS